MRTPTLGTIQFSVGNPGQFQSFDDVGRYLRELESRVAAAIFLLAQGHLDAVHAPPEKPSDGDIRHADGTHWNPGSGKGIYWYNATAGLWILLG